MRQAPVDGSPKVITAFQGQVEFYTRLQAVSTVKNVPISKSGPRNGRVKLGFDFVREFDVTDPENPIVVRSAGTLFASASLADRIIQQATFTFRGVTTSLKAFYDSANSCFQSLPEIQEVANPFVDGYVSASDSSGPPTDPDETLALCDESCGGSKRSIHEPRKAYTPGPDQYGKLKQTGPRELVITRTNGEFNVMTVFKSPAFKAVGLAATVAAVAFIILDFVDGKFKAATIGAATLLLGIGLAVEFGGPVGLVAGGIVATLFAILPDSSTRNQLRLRTTLLK